MSNRIRKRSHRCTLWLMFDVLFYSLSLSLFDSTLLPTFTLLPMTHSHTHINNFRWNSPICIDQLRNSGVFEAVAIRKSGFPFRLTHKQFASRYRCALLRKDMTWNKISSKPPMYRAMCEDLLKIMPFETSSIEIGKTMVLYKAGSHRLLELRRFLALDKLAPICQSVMRGT